MGLFSIVDDILGTDFSGKEAAKGAQQAANIQSEAGREALEVLRQDLAPFTQLGTQAAGQLMGSMLQPVSAQEVLEDPFYQALAQEQEQGALAQRAALGLAGSGGTQDILQRNLLQLGEGFRQNRMAEQQARFNQLFNISQMGQASAAQTGLTGANILTDIGSAQSMVPLTRAQSQGALSSGLLGLAGTIGGAMIGGPAGAAAGSSLGAGSAVGGFGGIPSGSSSPLQNFQLSMMP